MPLAKVGAYQFESMSCGELKEENERLLTEAIDHHPQSASAQDEEQRERDLGHISRDLDELNKAWTAKKC